jgi:flagellin-like protein
VKKGISPVIATVILVAVALVLAVALAGWVMGIWGGLGSTEALQISGYLNKTDSVVYLNATIINKGTAPANITNIVLVDETGTSRNASGFGTGIIVAPGGTNTTGPTYDVQFSSSTSVAVGKTYVVRFYTSSGNVYEVPMKCVKG